MFEEFRDSVKLNDWKVSLTVGGELVDWVAFASALHDMSRTAYINYAIQQDLEYASDDVKSAFRAFYEARHEAELRAAKPIEVPDGEEG